jgi:hypothetical protein
MRRLTNGGESRKEEGATLSKGPTPKDFRAKVFEDRETPGNWRVEKMDEDGGYQVVKVLTGPDARQHAIQYAEREFGAFDEIRLEAYRLPTGPSLLGFEGHGAS